MGLQRVKLTSKSWTAITTAGKECNIFIEKNIKGDGRVYINHSSSGLPKSYGMRLTSQEGNLGIYKHRPYDDDDILYVRLVGSGEVHILVDEYKSTMENGDTQKVYIQDQHTPAIIAHFNRVTNSTTLVVEAARGAQQITVASTTGSENDKYIIIFNPITARFYTGHQVGAAAVNVITLDTPLDSTFPAGSYVDIAVTNLNENGASTPVTFGLRGVGVPLGVELTFDVTRIIFQCITDTAVDLAKFGDLAALTNGLVCRKRDGDYFNIFNAKTNGDLAGIMYDWDAFSSTNPQQGVDGFKGRLTFAGQNKIGVTERLNLGEDLEIIIQDDLRDLVKFEIIAEGHIVQ